MVFQTNIKLAFTEISSFGKIGNKLLSQPLHTLHLKKIAKRGQKKPLSRTFKFQHISYFI